MNVVFTQSDAQEDILRIAVLRHNLKKGSSKIPLLKKHALSPSAALRIYSVEGRARGDFWIGLILDNKRPASLVQAAGLAA